MIPDSGKQLVYLDNAASSQTPTEVVDAQAAFHRQYCANVHRGVHYLSGKATDKYEAARQKVSEREGERGEVHAKSPKMRATATRPHSFSP
jgi:selenocysteine lyase/cysteine desulfurase